jgi:hypothetical protein
VVYDIDDEVWVSRNKERILYPPIDHKPTKACVQENVLALGAYMKCDGRQSKTSRNLWVKSTSVLHATKSPAVPAVGVVQNDMYAGTVTLRFDCQLMLARPVLFKKSKVTQDGEYRNIWSKVDKQPKNTSERPEGSRLGDAGSGEQRAGGRPTLSGNQQHAELDKGNSYCPGGLSSKLSCCGLLRSPRFSRRVKFDNHNAATKES